MSKEDGWREFVLEEVAEIIISNVDKKSINGETPVRLCNYMDVYSNEYISKPLDFMEATATLIEIKRFAIETGDVIITKDSETPDDIGIPSVVTGSFSNLICGYHLALLKPKKALIDPVFLSKMISSPQIASYYGKIASGSTRFGLSNSGIAKTPLKIPPLPQQCKIAKILTTVDTLIEKTEALIAKYQSIKQGMMHDLFTRGVDAKGKLRPPQSEAPELYKQSELGWIPKEWEEQPLHQHCTLQGGYAFRSEDFVNEGIQLVRIGNLFSSELDLNRDPVCLPTSYVRLYSEFVLRSGDILISLTGTFGKQDYGYAVQIPLTNEVYLLNQRVARFKLIGGLLRDFLIHALHSQIFLSRLYSLAGGTKQANLTNQQVLSVPIPVPPKIEQEAILDRLNLIVRVIQAELLIWLKWRAKKTALMQDLLTGKVQVTPDAEDKELAHA